jgi:hypothetical protein
MNEGRNFWSTPEEWLMLAMIKAQEAGAHLLASYHRLTSAKRVGDKEERFLQSVQYWVFWWPVAPAYRRWRTTGRFRR